MRVLVGGTLVLVGGTRVGVLVGGNVLVGTRVFVAGAGVGVSVGTRVRVLLGVGVAVLLGVGVFDGVGVLVLVAVFVLVGVFVATGVLVGVFVRVGYGVKVATVGRGGSARPPGGVGGSFWSSGGRGVGVGVPVLRRLLVMRFIQIFLVNKRERYSLCRYPLPSFRNDCYLRFIAFTTGS